MHSGLPYADSMPLALVLDKGQRKDISNPCYKKHSHPGYFRGGIFIFIEIVICQESLVLNIE
jgi:hypothetical protein